ncbi:MAG: RNA methyltransferase [Ktedonobacterales bacterium]
MNDRITSAANQHIALLRSLHTPKGRAAENAFLVEGPHLLDAAFDAHITPQLIVYDPDVLERSTEGRRLLARLLDAQAAGAMLYEAAANAIARASDTQAPQGIVAAVSLEDVAPNRVRASRRGRARPLLLALDGVGDPGNVGTILRSALAADVDEVLLAPGCVDPFAPKVVRAGSGAHFFLSIRAEQTWEEIAQRFAGAPSAQQVLVAEASGHRAYDECDLTQRTALIIGNEAHGLSNEAARLATERISIPMWNRVESLNAAIAASVILFEAGRQRRMKDRNPEGLAHGADDV